MVLHLATYERITEYQFRSEESGSEAYKRYSGIISPENPPFVRASSGVRVVESATNWTGGMSPLITEIHVAQFHA